MTKTSAIFLFISFITSLTIVNGQTIESDNHKVTVDIGKYHVVGPITGNSSYQNFTITWETDNDLGMDVYMVDEDNYQRFVGNDSFVSIQGILNASGFMFDGQIHSNEDGVLTKYVIFDNMDVLGRRLNGDDTKPVSNVSLSYSLVYVRSLTDLGTFSASDEQDDKPLAINSNDDVILHKHSIKPNERSEETSPWFFYVTIALIVILIFLYLTYPKRDVEKGKDKKRRSGEKKKR